MKLAESKIELGKVKTGPQSEVTPVVEIHVSRVMGLKEPYDTIIVDIAYASENPKDLSAKHRMVMPSKMWEEFSNLVNKTLAEVEEITKTEFPANYSEPQVS